MGYRERVFELLREANRLETPDRDLATLRREAAEALGDFVGIHPRMLSGPLLPKRIEYTIFDPLTNRLAIWRDDGKVRFIDPAVECEVASLSVPDQELKKLSFAPDGRRPASQSANGTVRVFGAPGTFRSFHVAVSADGRWAAAERTSERVALVDLEQGEITWNFRGERSPVWSLAFSPDGRRLAVGLSDGGLAVWNLDRVRTLIDEVLPQSASTETSTH